MQSLLKVGIDIGSTTIKVIVLDAKNHLLYKKYVRHFSEITAALQDNFLALKNVVGASSFSFALTGSAGMGIAQKFSLPFVQEVIACSAAVKAFVPQTDTAVELGGEDAKITYFGAAQEQRMNGVCAGGTGSFIDHMASLLHTDAQGLDKLAAKGQQIYPIASRCGVFAKTDIQALMNDGAEKEDIARSVFQAVVNQTIGNLAQGRPITGNVAFLGGPLYFLPQLKNRFIETLELDTAHVVDFSEGCYFVAMGAVLSNETEIMDYETLAARFADRGQWIEKSAANHFILFKDDEARQEFTKRHEKDKISRGDLSQYKGKIYLGIDAGSTTTKIVAIGQNKEILYSSYGSNQGSPLKTVITELQDLYTKLNAETQIACTGTTGYGEYLVKAAIHADFGEVETFAHLRAAQEFCPAVSFVLDIGGQDMKCFFVKDGTIDQIVLNEACSAGCGSFIENFAQSLNLTAGEFAQRAMQSHKPVDLGTRCTVFMNSKVKQVQKEGADVSDISAGIALSIIKNALFKVIQIKDVNELGTSIVVQGGTFYNDAVLRSMELLLDRPVIRPDISGLMGAYGAAILAQERSTGTSAILPEQEITNFTVTTTSHRCKICGNQCLITTQKFSNGEKYHIGNRCERGIGQPKKENKVPNIYEYKYYRLFDFYKPLAHPSRGTIGMPRVLNMYEDYPFWFTFFTMLGYKVILSGKSTPEMYHKGMATIPSDSLCYPAKLVHGHIMDLIHQGIKKIFYPCIPYNMKDTMNPSDNHYNCPVVASYAENIRANMDVLRTENIQFMQPFLPMDDRLRLITRLTEEFAIEHISKKEILSAVDAAYIELEKYKKAIRVQGMKILEQIETENLHGIVLAGRPYHLDPEINHGIAEMIQSYGLAVLSEDVIYQLHVEPEKLQIMNQWSYHARLYHAASYVAAHENLTLIQLSSFGCGLDAITIGQVKEIMEQHQRIYTMIKLDEVTNLGAARIRLRSLMAALQKVPHHKSETKVIEARPIFSQDKKETNTILAPQLSPIHFSLITTALRKYGYKVVIPELPNRAAIDLGLRYVNNDMCYPAIVIIGQLLAALKSGVCDPDKTSIMLFQTCGACRATNYLSLMRKALKDAGYPQVAVFACWGPEQDAFSLNIASFTDVIKSIMYGDLLMRLVNRIRPYEVEAGSTQRLYEKCLTSCKKEILNGNYVKFKRTVQKIVHEFDHCIIHEHLWKPKVGVVGEILVKYHPVANNHLEKILANEGAEVIMPDMMDFLFYMAVDDIVKYRLLAGKLSDKMKSEVFIKVMEMIRHPIRHALKKSQRFTAPNRIRDIAELAKKHVSLGNMAGEGWFLTGEMLKLIESGTKNIICLQPFGCLPNHITGKGMIREILRSYPDSNVIAVDCDAGVSEVNQLNRIKLMLSVAKEKKPLSVTEAIL